MGPRACAPAALAAAIVVIVPVVSFGSDRAPVHAAAGAAAAGHRAGVLEDCSMRSEATFPHALADPRNVVAGPLVFIGAGYTSESTVRRFGGNKFPLLVKAGHTVTVTVAPSVRAVAALAYGPLPQGRNLRVRDGHDTVTFVACRDDQPSGSTADGPVTFWPGGILADRPTCVPLDVYVDDQPSPLHIEVSLGVRCPASDVPRGTEPNG